MSALFVSYKYAMSVLFVN